MVTDSVWKFPIIYKGNDEKGYKRPENEELCVQRHIYSVWMHTLDHAYALLKTLRSIVVPNHRRTILQVAAVQTAQRERAGVRESRPNENAIGLRVR